MSLRRQFYLGATLFFLLPLALLFGEWSEPSAFTLNFLIFGIVFLLLVPIWRWDIIGYYFQPMLFLAFLIICFHKGGWPALFGAAASLLLLWLLLSRPRTKSFIDCSFPLRNGWCSVAQGGSLMVINRHRVSRSQRYALDIVRLNKFGFRARGLYPTDLKAYAVFESVLYSPCDGVVTAVVNDLPDLSPGEMDPKRPAGNQIVIWLAGSETYVGLAHLAQGSIRVQPGAKVAVGQPLAQVGNSGNTSEPHLHIHAKRGGRPDSMLDGEGVAIRFAGKWLIRNSLVHAPAGS